MQKNKAITFMCITTVLTACAPSGQRPTEPKLTVTGAPVLHAIDNQELRTVMNRINNLMHERNLTDLEMDKQRKEGLDAVLKAANGVEQALGGMVAAEPRLNLDAGERKVFHSLAANLNEEAKTLKAQTVAQQTDAIPATLEKMNTTCNSCHELFRDFRKPGAQ